MKSMSPVISLLLLSIATGLFPLTASKTVAEASEQPGRSASSLLDTANRLAVAIPSKPHITDRSLAQYRVFGTALELGKTNQALEYAREIENWRKGLAYADYAYYCAKSGDATNAVKYLGIIEMESGENTQAWRNDRIRARVAATWLLLGSKEKARESGLNLAESEAGTLSVELEGSELTDTLEKLQSMARTGGIDLVRNALQGYTDLYSRFFDDESVRNELEKAAKDSWNTLPYPDRIDFLLTLSKIALEKGGRNESLRLANEADALFKSLEWPAEFETSISSRIIIQQWRCGEKELTHVRLQQVLTSYREKRENIVNIDRAEALVPLAEAFIATGHSADAAAVYHLAIAESVENPNSRPRAEDLSQICLSMATAGFSPDQAMMQRIRELEAALGDPW